MGAHMNGIRNMLVVTGDPVPSGDKNAISSVYDFNSIRLMNYFKQLNSEHFADDPIIYGGALNYGRTNIDKEIKRMQKKMSREEGEQTGIEIALEIVEKLEEVADGYYFMVPFNRASMICKILNRLHR